jgi:hypothetical protein
MTIEVQSDGEHLIFEDYLNRKVTINHEDYLNLMMFEKRRAYRPALEDCLKDPTEVWWSIEHVDGVDYTLYKYIKVYKNLVFIAYVVVEDMTIFKLNNFFGFDDNEIAEADRERCGQLVLSKFF